MGKPESLIRYVKDRPGHDRRYAMDFSLAKAELGFARRYNFEQGLAETIARHFPEVSRGWLLTGEGHMLLVRTRRTRTVLEIDPVFFPRNFA